MILRRFFLTIVVMAFMVIQSILVFAEGEIVWSQGMDTTIKSEFSKVQNYFFFSPELVTQNKKIFRTWVAGSIDLQKAQRRVSEIYNRTTYRQEITTEILRLPSERLKFTEKQISADKVIVPQLQLQNVRPITSAKPILVIYRESPNSFSYSKLKEVPSTNPLATSEITSLAKTFLLKNRMLIETTSDKVGRTYVQNRRIAEELRQEGKENNYITQQDVVFERSLQGKPVLNSKLVISIIPKTKEIIGFKHYNWTTVTDERGTKIPSKTLRTFIADPVRTIKQRLEQKIRAEGNFSKATVVKLIPAWFQTEKGLIPVMAFDVYTEYPSEKGPLSRNYMEVLNLVGDDGALYPNQIKAQNPSKASQ